MKTYLLLVIHLFLISSLASARTQFLSHGLLNPESVYFDPETKFIFVSSQAGDNMKKDGVGWISKMSQSSAMISEKWVEGLSAPRGMRSYQGILWVTDIDQVVGIDIKSASIIKKISIKGAVFLNDLAIDESGTIYVSDTLKSSIHIIKNDVPKLFMEGQKLESPNGLIAKDGRLYVASWGYTKDWSTKKLGRLYFIDIKTKKITYITKSPLGNLDGLEIDKLGDFIVSDWMTGKIYRVNSKGETTLLKFLKKGSADLGYVPELNTIIVPNSLDNLLYAF